MSFFESTKGFSKSLQIDKYMFLKKWCLFHFKLNRMKWLDIKQIVESNDLKLKATVTVWSLSYITTKYSQSGEFENNAKTEKCKN